MLAHKVHHEGHEEHEAIKWKSLAGWRSRLRGPSKLKLFVPFVSFVVALVFTATPHAQSGGNVFDNTRIHDVRLLVNSKELALLRQNWQLDTKYPADLVVDGVRIRSVAVRNRGSGSRNPHKLGLEIDFDRYVRAQRFQGLRQLVLDNQWQDETLLREPLALAMFHRVGLPGSRQSFARFFINGEFQGLYSLLEPIDELFLKRVFNDEAGYLHEYRWQFHYTATYLGDDLGIWKPLFAPRSHELDTDEPLWGPIRDLFKAVNHTDEEAWRDAVDQRVDLIQLIRYIALENYLGENDGWTGFDGMNNFYVYRPADSVRNVILTWDKDQSFIFKDQTIFRGFEENEVLKHVNVNPELRAIFLDAMESYADTAADGDWFANELERIIALIQPVVYEDSKKQFTNDDFDATIAFVREFMIVRPPFVKAEVAANR
jgi:spore coat protein CotH